MKVLIAMDSFKGNFTSSEVAGIVEKGIRRVYKDALVDKVVIADGGEGTVEAMLNCLEGNYVSAEVQNPLGEKTTAKYAIVGGNTAVIEMAEASGLSLVPEDKRNPLITSTFGTGELIRDALSKGCKKIILGIGGSATNDGGMGMAKALGVKFLDERGGEIGDGGGTLKDLARIDAGGLLPSVSDTYFLVACDVNNPLYGESGASCIFGPQKGASESMVRMLDQNLKNYAEVIKKDLGKSVADIPGSGAAGGLGAGLIAFCGATLKKGTDVILDTIHIEEKIKAADVVITGEGRVDYQTAYGKVPVGIASRAKKYRKPVFLICGFIGNGAEQLYDYGVDAVMSSIVAPMTLEDSIGKSATLLEESAERLFRIIRAVR